MFTSNQKKDHDEKAKVTDIQAMLINSSSNPYSPLMTSEKSESFLDIKKLEVEIKSANTTKNQDNKTNIQLKQWKQIP